MLMRKAGLPRASEQASLSTRHGQRSHSWPGGLMPTRRTMELMIVTVVLLHPVISMWRIWAAKHLATSNNQSTSAGAEVALNVL
jgi:hypothetical protein